MNIKSRDITDMPVVKDQHKDEDYDSFDKRESPIKLFDKNEPKNFEDEFIGQIPPKNLDKSSQEDSQASSDVQLVSKTSAPANVEKQARESKDMNSRHMHFEEDKQNSSPISKSNAIKAEPIVIKSKSSENTIKDLRSQSPIKSEGQNTPYKYDEGDELIVPKVEKQKEVENLNVKAKDYDFEKKINEKLEPEFPDITNEPTSVSSAVSRKKNTTITTKSKISSKKTIWNLESKHDTLQSSENVVEIFNLTKGIRDGIILTI